MPRTRVTATNVAVVNANISAIVTLPGISVQANNPVDLIGEVDISPSTGTTGTLILIYRSATATGTIVQQLGPFPPASGGRGMIVIEATDIQAVDVAGQQYTLAVQAQGQTVTSAVNYAELRADY